MGSKSSDRDSSEIFPSNSSSFVTSTFLSSKRLSTLNPTALGNHKKRSGSRYSSMGTVGRSCVNTIKRSRQNVAIATQVLNPSAIGGALKGQRGAKHFGPPDDDEEGFITYRRRAAWKTLCYYGTAIVAVILILTAIILAVGYMQSEKQRRILSRSVKLIQRNPSVYEYNSTTQDPPSLQPTDSHEFYPTAQSSFLKKVDSAEDESTNEYFFTSGEPTKHKVGEDDEEYYIPYNPDEDNGSHHQVGHNIGNHPPFSVKSRNPFLFVVNNDRIVDDIDNETENGENKGGSSEGDGRKVSSGDKLDNDLDAVIVDHESVDDVNNNEDWKSENEQEENKAAEDQQQSQEDEAIIKDEGHDHRLLSEVKVLPPNDFVFSIEIPIYTPNNTISVDANSQKDSVVEVDKDIEHFSSRADNSDDSHDDPIDDAKETKDQDVKVHDLDEDKQLESESKEVNGEDGSKESDIIEEVEESSSNENAHKNLASKFKAILHTALFEDTEPETSRFLKKEDSGDAIKVTSKEEPVSIDYHPETSDSNEDMVDRSRGRNRKIKIYKNDKVLNLKATYTPPPKKSQLNPQTSETKLEEKPLRRVFAQFLQLGEDRKHEFNEVLNKTLNMKQRTKLASKNNDFVNIKDFVPETPSKQRGPLASSTKHSSASLKVGEKSEEKARLLPSSPLMESFESYLKSILLKNGVDLKYLPRQPEPKEIPDQQNHATTDFGANFAHSLNQFLPPPSTLDSTPPGLDNLDTSQFSKRTFNSYDFGFGTPTVTSPSFPVTQNYFDHLLGQNPTVATIGNPSASAASLNNYYAPLYPPASPASFYDYNSNGNDAPTLAPGSIPLDLASSYIPVGLPSQQSGQGGYNNGGYGSQGGSGGGIFGYPTSDSDKTHYGNNHNGGVGSVTTIAGLPPQYNTISQGMNLLNLISGTLPNTYFHDQVYNPSSQVSTSHHFPQDNNNFNLNTPSQLNFGNIPSTIAAPIQTFNPNDFMKNIADIGASQAQYSGGTSQYSGVASQYSQHQKLPSWKNRIKEHKPSLQSSSSELVQSREDYSSSDYNGDENDQLPAASSFTHNILTTFQSPAVKKLSQAAVESSTLKNTIKLLMKPKKRRQNFMDLTAYKQTQSEPKSFSFEILPGRGSTTRKDFHSDNIIDDTLNSLNVDVIHSTLDNFVSGSKSKKKSSVSHEIPLKINPGKPSPPTTRRTTLKLTNGGSTNTQPKPEEVIVPRVSNNPQRKPPSSTSNNGLRSGFFTP